LVIEGSWQTSLTTKSIFTIPPVQTVA